MRETLAFIATLVGTDRDGTPAQRWVDGDARPVETAAEAVRFTCYRSPSQRDRIAIQRESHDLVGGLRNFVDLTDGVARSWQFLVDRIASALWPQGRPEAKGPDRETQEEAFRAAWAADDSPEMLGFRDLRDQHDRVMFLATWKALLVSATCNLDGRPVDVTAAWRGLADRDDVDEVVFQSLWSAWLAAHEERDRGKA